MCRRVLAALWTGGGSGGAALSGGEFQTARRGFVLIFVFYRAMHFSAKRGIAIACRLSVCLSVCNVGEL